MKPAPTERKTAADHGNHGRRAERQPRERRSGEGSESALANLRSIERDRQKTRVPTDDGNRG